MAAATAAPTVDPPGYFVGKPLHYQEPQPQAVPPPPPQPQPEPPAAAPAVDDQNAVSSQVPGYYKGRVQPRPNDVTPHNNANSNAGAAEKQSPEPSCFAKWFAGCFGSS